MSFEIGCSAGLTHLFTLFFGVYFVALNVPLLVVLGYILELILSFRYCCRPTLPQRGNLYLKVSKGANNLEPNLCANG